MTWSEQIKTRRHELQLTQTAVASRIGITTNYLARLENAHDHPSSGLQAQIDRTLKDWSDLSPLTVQVIIYAFAFLPIKLTISSKIYAGSTKTLSTIRTGAAMATLINTN